MDEFRFKVFAEIQLDRLEEFEQAVPRLRR